MNQIVSIASVAAESLVQEKGRHIVGASVITAGVVGEKINESIEAGFIPDWLPFGDITLLIGCTVGVLTVMKLYKENKLLSIKLSKEDRRSAQKQQE